jgi:hypothetical protein
MERNIEKALYQGRFPPDPMRQDRESFAGERGEVPILSAYTLALRDPELFLLRYTGQPKSIH